MLQDTDKPMKLIQLRQELCGLFRKIKSGKVSAKKAERMTSAAREILQSAKVEIEYSRLHEKQRIIEFIE